MPTQENEIISILLNNLDSNYINVENKIEQIKQNIQQWHKDFELIYENQDLLGGKEIWKQLKNKIFNNPPLDKDIAKDIATLMEKDNYIPHGLAEILEISL